MTFSNRRQVEFHRVYSNGRGAEQEREVKKSRFELILDHDAKKELAFCKAKNNSRWSQEKKAIIISELILSQFVELALAISKLPSNQFDEVIV